MLPRVNHLCIVAGGLGTRLASVAGDLPKALLPIGGKPILQHQLELATATGIDEVTIFAGYMAQKISGFIEDGSRFGARVRVVVETKPMGNAGAILQSLASLPEHFIVVYGDVMLAVDLQRIAHLHLERRADFTTLAHPNDHPYDSDLLETDANDWVTAVHTCPHTPGCTFDNLVNAGLYVVRRDALRSWAEAPTKKDFKDIMAGLISKGCRVLAHRSSEYIKDMGTSARLQQVEADWQAGKISLKESQQCRPAIFLDRDGTLNVEKGHLRSPAELDLLPGVGAALRLLRQSGFRLVVLTNQPVIARGEATEADVDAIHRRLQWDLGKQGAYLDAIYVCPHHPDRGFPGERPDLKVHCECRKPGIGLFERACRDLSIDVANSWMIGDQPRDIEMARRAGLRAILVQKRVTADPNQFASAPPHIADDLASAAGFILEHERLIPR